MSGGTAYWLSGPAAQQDQPGWFALKGRSSLPTRSMDATAWYRSERLGPASAEGAVARR